MTFIKPILALFIFILYASLLYAQTSNQLLRGKLASADSVLIISYKNKKEIGLDSLFTDTLLSKSMITNRVKLQHTQIQELANIFALKTENPSRRSTYKKQDASEAIILFRKGILSYIIICFDCKKSYTSDDIEYDLFEMDQKSWKPLRAFFVRQGVMTQ